MTAPQASGPARPAMRWRDFDRLAAEVANTCQQHGVAARTEHDRDRLDAALWRFAHPDLAGGPADPYADPDEE